MLLLLLLVRQKLLLLLSLLRVSDLELGRFIALLLRGAL